MLQQTKMKQMNENIIKDNIKVTDRNGISYLHDKTGRITNKPWLGNLFSFCYDLIMEKSIFPKKFEASFDIHYEILSEMLEDVCYKAIVEFATGSGDAIKFLSNKNTYTGVDISPRLLRIAKKKFDQHSFTRYQLVVANACETPFRDHVFDVAICNLSLNFFQDIVAFIIETRRVLKDDGVLFGCIPIPERRSRNSNIHGKLYSVNELEALFEDNAFSFWPLSHDNGALLYFRANVSQSSGLLSKVDTTSNSSLAT